MDIYEISKGAAGRSGGPMPGRILPFAALGQGWETFARRVCATRCPWRPVSNSKIADKIRRFREK